MIYPTSIPYEITVYDVRSQNLHPDGTPKAEEPQLVTKLMEFPQDVIDRIHVMTDNVSFRRFVKGLPLTNIDWAWLFICFDTPIPHHVVSQLREEACLNMNQWGFYTFDEKRLDGFRAGGDPPDIDVITFLGIAVAAKAMKVLGSPQLIGELRLRPDQSYFMFGRYDLHNVSLQENINRTT
jgi:hypothetical protein